MNKRFIKFVWPLMLLGYLCSCSSPKNIPYFQDLPDSLDTLVTKAAYSDPKIQPDDILSITIQTTDPSATASVNQNIEGISVIGASSERNIGSQQVSGFLVDKNGEVELPMLGVIKLAGMTTFEAREKVRQAAKAYFVNPSVQVRFVNFKITMIGEVTRPATYTIPSEKVTVLDALGLAGDLTIYGKRENVLLIRESPKGKQMIRFNLNDTRMLASPYFYLKQNDVIYVEPNKAKVATTDAARTRSIAIFTSIASVITIVISRLL